MPLTRANNNAVCKQTQQWGVQFNHPGRSTARDGIPHSIIAIRNVLRQLRPGTGFNSAIYNLFTSEIHRDVHYGAAVFCALLVIIQNNYLFGEWAGKLSISHSL
jgi:hypothetical protein